jgi:hypothetical protein
MSFVVKDSTALLKRNKLNNQEEETKDQEVNKHLLLENVLRIIEVDRILLNNLNAIIVHDINSHLEAQQKGDKNSPGNIDFIKETLKFTTLCFFKRAFLIMQILKLLERARSGAGSKVQNSINDNQELSQIEFVLCNFKWFFFMLRVCSPTKDKKVVADVDISDDKMILFHALRPFKVMINEINTEF